MKERYGAKDPRSWMMRFHSQTAGVTLTAQQPMNNVVRVAYQALAAVLGGTQSLHTNSMDETLALPTEEAVQVALRTQQMLAYETGVPNVIDPLGGSYYVEALTDQLEREAEALFAEIERVGGVAQGLETGWFQRKIAESAARQQWEIEQHRRVVVGVNEFVTDEPELTIPVLKVGEAAERRQGERMARLRAERDRRPVHCGARRPPRRRPRHAQPDALHPRMRAIVLHAVRDPRRDGGRVRRLSGAGVLLNAAGSRVRNAGSGEWWRDYFDAQYLLEYEPIFTPERARRDVARVVELLGLPAGARVLDVPCGQGRHAHLLAEAGFRVDGLDYSRELLARARERGTGPALRYHRGDMRVLPARWTARFDAVVNLFTSFGFFADPRDDARTIAEFARVLKPGAR